MKFSPRLNKSRKYRIRLGFQKCFNSYTLVALFLSLLILLIIPPLVTTFFSYFSPFEGIFDWLITIFLDTEWYHPGNPLPEEATNSVNEFRRTISIMHFAFMTSFNYAVIGSANGFMIEWLYSSNKRFSKATKRSTAWLISPISLTLIYWNRLPFFVNPFEFVIALVVFTWASVYVTDSEKVNVKPVKAGSNV